MSEVPPDPQAFNAYEAAGWESKAGGYDDFFGPITAQVIDPLLDAARVSRGTRVLDVACGPGHLAAAAAARGAKAVGVDVAATMVERARALHSGVEFLQGDAERLQFPDRSFDAVVAGFAVLHLGAPERAAGEFLRVLVPGGRVALSMWDSPERARFIGVFFDAVAAAGAGPPPGIPAGPPVFRFSDEAELGGLLEGAGFEEVRIETVGFTLKVRSADELWDGMLGGTVRTAALVLGQPPDVQERIRAEVDRLAEGYREDDGLALPVSVKVASGLRPPR